MPRDLQKTINEYKRKYYNRKDSKGAFYASDIRQIMDISFEESKSPAESRIDAISNALYAGFIIGYKAAKREQTKVKAGTR